MEKRVLIAITLSFLVLYAYQALFPPPTPEPRPEPAAATGPNAGAPAAPSAETKPGLPPPPPSAVEPTATPLVGDTSEREVRVETRDVIAVFTNRGARLKSWRLKKYQDSGRQPVELIANDIGPDHPLPFSLRVQDEAMTKTLNSALYSVSGATSDEGPIAAPARLKFEYGDSAGLRAVKEFQIDPASYVISFTVSATSGERDLAPALNWGPGLGDKDGAAGSALVQARGIFAVANEVTRIAAPDAAETPSHQGDFQYAGVDDHYFISAALKPGPSRISYQPITIPASEGSGNTNRELMAFTLDPGSRDGTHQFYVGPKDFDVLASVDRDLVRAIDFGMFAVIVVPLLRTLNWIYGFVANYGWAIVILTVIINLLMFPLRHKQVVSMRKMQEIQPEVKAIQERYAKYKTTDPAKQKMNQEVMALYRERGVNPAAGCVPMLLPLPVFFAFYALLYGAIELRGAPFVGWIQDLSQPDPLYITPALMVVTQVLQTWMMPAAGMDPIQQKMMLVMPIVLGFIFVTMPSGVVIYWVVNNIWGIGQQLVTNRLIGPPNVRNPRPPAERRIKRVGGGKTDLATEN
jgi:YidC/Oxa1 family membrane protein insertase